MRWTHKHLRKIGYTLLFMAFALPKVGFFIFVFGVIAFELALGNNVFKFAVKQSDDSIKTKLKELESTPTREKFIRQEASDRAGTALVDGFLYLWGPAVLLLVGTLNGNMDFIPKEILEKLPPKELRRQMTLSTGSTLYFVSLWMMAQYLGRYARTKKKLKELKDDENLKLYRKLCGSVRPICWLLALAPFVLLKFVGAEASPYIPAAILMLPTLWPIAYASLALRSQRQA